MLDIRPDMAALHNVFAAFDQKNANQVIAQALNDTARQSRSQAARIIAKRGSFRVAFVRNRLQLVLAKPGNLSALVLASGRPVPLFWLGRATQTKKGVRALAWGKRKLYAGAFFATMPTRHTGIFTRKTGARLPIRELYGPSIPGILRQEGVNSAIKGHVTERLKANLLRQTDRRLRLLAGKARR